MDLDVLCADRPLTTDHVFSPNAYYGNGDVLQRWAGLRHRPKVAIQHGVCLHDWLWSEEQNSPHPVYCWQENRLELWRTQTPKKVIAGAAPFLYALELTKDERQPERRGTVFFPAHSTHHALAEMDAGALADKLLALPDEYQPVTVCMYWRGYLNQFDIPYRERDLGVTSAGHIFDNEFLYRLARILRRHKYAASNDIGSQLFYSVMAGCSFFYIEHPFDFSGPEPDLVRQVAISKPKERFDYFAQMFAEPRETMTDEQVRVVREYTGARYLTTPEQLREQIG